MSTPWATYNEVSQNKDPQRFAVYRCPDPVGVITQEPWFPILNICPCDPNLSNKTGRGFTACNLGINETASAWDVPAFQQNAQIPPKELIVGNLYNTGQYVPPNMSYISPLMRIGQSWRSNN